MIELTLLIVISSLWCNAAYDLTQESGLLHFIRKALDKVFHIEEDRYRKIYYPILHCITCMASLHTVLIYIATMPLHSVNPLYLLLAVPCVSLLNQYINARLFE